MPKVENSNKINIKVSEADAQKLKKLEKRSTRANSVGTANSGE